MKLKWTEKLPAQPRICSACKAMMQQRGNGHDYLGHSGPCDFDDTAKPEHQP